MSLPVETRALLALLSGKSADRMPQPVWKDLLAFADRTQCTLFLRPCEEMPDWFREAMEARRQANRKRRERLRSEYWEAANALKRGGIEFVLLKGFTHETGFGFEGEDRVQYDIDLLCRAADRAQARKLLGKLGYAPQEGRELSGVHGRPLVQASTWVWRGDYYDVDMPVAVEVHHQVWNGERDRLPLDTGEFWDRRGMLAAGSLRVPALCEEDRVAFAALHVLRHALHNNLRLSHAVELSRLLAHRAADKALWQRWQETHGARSRMLQAVAMRLAEAWFPGDIPSAVADEWQQFPRAVKRWFGGFAFSPVENLTAPNKNILWLHRELVEGSWRRLALVVGRLVPLKLPEPGRARERLGYHARALLPALAGLRRLRKTSSSAPQTSD